jgi:hypothetical protein
VQAKYHEGRTKREENTLPADMEKTIIEFLPIASAVIRRALEGVQYRGSASVPGIF